MCFPQSKEDQRGDRVCVAAEYEAYGANASGAAASMITHPILSLMVGPQPPRAWRPYGAATKSRAKKTTTASKNQPIMRPLKSTCSLTMTPLFLISRDGQVDRPPQTT